MFTIIGLEGETTRPLARPKFLNWVETYPGLVVEPVDFEAQNLSAEVVSDFSIVILIGVNLGLN